MSSDTSMSMAMDGTSGTTAPCDSVRPQPTSTLPDDERSLLELATSASARPTGARRGRVVSIAGALCLGGALAALTLRPAARESSLITVDAGATEKKFVGAAISALAEALIGGAGLAREFSKDYTDVEKLLHERGFSDELTEFSRRVSKRVRDKELNFDNETWKKFLNTTNMDQIKLMLKPHLNRHDGNKCMDDEEMHGGLCYKTCKALTDGEYPIRVTAFECCRKAPCIWADVRFEFSICGGFDVSGDQSLNRCPHIPGSCFANEELFNGLCYKQCAMLTEGKYGWRTGPSTCCVFRYAAGCSGGGTAAGGAYAVTNASFDVGGGTGEPGSPKTVHPPILKLTEDPGDLEDKEEFARIEQERREELEAEEKVKEAADKDAAAAAEDKDCEDKLGAKYGMTIGKMACEAARAASSDTDQEEEEEEDAALAAEEDASSDADQSEEEDAALAAEEDAAPAPAPERRAKDEANDAEKAGTKQEVTAMTKLDKAVRKLARDLGQQKEEAAAERRAEDGRKEAKKAGTKRDLAALQRLDEAVEKLSKDVSELASSLKSVDE